MTIDITGDSGEYEFLKDGIELSKDVEGMTIEIGVRRGMGTKTIIDAVRQFCPNKTVVAVDCYGSILYVGREHVGPIRLDYDNNMKADCMVALWSYVRENYVNFRPETLTDYAFFKKYSDGVPKYDIDETIETLYAFVHLDGPHNYEHVSTEMLWFNERMLPGATIIIDDVTPDFIDIEPIKKLFTELGWELVKMGEKKGLWRKN